jgi:hypothetical protein
MSFRPAVWIFSVFLLTNLGQPATANADDDLVFWNQSVATAVNDAITTDDACRTSPYALYRQTCVGNSLNITLERDPFETLTYLDHIALFVHKYKDLNTTQQIMPGIRFKMGVNLSNVYEQEAVLHARLRIRW